MPLNSSNEKVKEICDLLYKETILPAKEESEQRVVDAKDQAASIIHAAKEEAKTLLEENKKQLSEERRVHDASVQLAITRALAVLKCSVMEVLNSDLMTNLKGALNEQFVCQNILEVLVEGLKKDGVKSDLRLYISKNVDFDKLASSMVGSLAGKLEKGDVEINSGIALMLKDKKITLKVTDETIKELLAAGLPEVLKNKVFA